MNKRSWWEKVGQHQLLYQTVVVILANTESQRQVRVSRAQALAANAVAQVDHDPELALLLVMQAISTTRVLGEPIVPQAEDALHEVLDTSPLLRTLHGHIDLVWSAAWSPDGKSIVTASRDTTAQVWDATSGQARVTLVGHTAALYSAAWSPDGRYVVTASADETARQYIIPIDELMALAASRVNRALTPDERFRYLGEPLPTPTPDLTTPVLVTPTATPAPSP